MNEINSSNLGRYFYEHYFDETISEEKKKEVCNLKNGCIPPLYKYASTNHVEDLLCDDLMFLSPISSLNDPNEGAVKFNISSVLKNIIKYHEIKKLLLMKRFIKY